MNRETSYRPEVAEVADIQQVLVGFADYVSAEKELRDFESEDTPEASARKAGLLRVATAYHVRLMEVVLAHRETPEELATMWKKITQYCLARGDAYRATSMRRGILSQVATYRVFERLGRTPTLATPDEDAFRAVDLWEDARTAVQVKWSNDVTPELLDTDALPMPAVAVRGAEGTQYYASNTLHEATRFRKKLQSFAREGRRVHGHLLVVPDRMINRDTGEPTQEIVDFVRTHLGLEGETKLAA